MNNSLEQLTELLELDLKHTTELCAVLEKEKQVLIDREFEALSKLATEKQTLLDKVEQNNKQKLAILSPFANGETQESLLNTFVKQYGEAAALKFKALNQKLDDKLAQCREQNAVNGQVIVRNLSNNKELLSILTGKQNNEGDLYNALGKVSQSKNNKPYHDEV